MEAPEIITDNADLGRFELVQGGETAFARYRKENGVLLILHVEAPPALRGTGAAGRLMQGIMQAARSQSLKILPICGYAAAWMQRHPECQDLLA